MNDTLNATLSVTSYPTAKEFLAQTQSWLEASEVENSLILGLALMLIDKPNYYGSDPMFKAIISDEKPLLACLMTPPHNLIITSDSPDPHPALRALADDLWLSHWSVPGVNARRDLSEHFSEEWHNTSGDRVVSGMKQRLYKLSQVIPPAPVPGRLRVADETHRNLLSSWTIEFQLEAVNNIVSPDEALQSTDRRIAQGYLYFWEDGSPVSMAAKTRPNKNGVAVGLVYTPPEHRRKGYASALVAALSQSLLDSGFDYCTLYTDLSFPTSNHIYQAIGYEPVCDFVEYKFASF